MSSLPGGSMSIILTTARASVWIAGTEASARAQK